VRSCGRRSTNRMRWPCCSRRNVASGSSEVDRRN
jgi:hypothetical protein